VIIIQSACDTISIGWAGCETGVLVESRRPQYSCYAQSSSILCSLSLSNERH